MDAPSYRTHHMRRLVAQAGGPAGWIRKHAGTRWQQAQVSQWISESNPKGIGHKLARDLEVAMGLPHGYLDLPGDGAEAVTDAGLTADHAHAVKVAEPETVPGYVRVEQIDATAGMGGAVINDDHPEIIRSVEYREAYIRALIGFVPPPGRLKLVTGAGDSMRPVIEPGEAMLMDSGVTTFQADGIYWIALGDRDDGHQIKMLQERGDGLWVISANPNYPPFPFPENGRIGGRLYIRHKIERFN